MSKAEDVSKMSEKNTEKKPVKNQDKKAGGNPSFLAKVGAWFYRVFFLSFKNMVAELKKVTWPSRKDLTNYSIVVISFMVLMAVVIGLLDMGVTALLQRMISG